MKSCYRSQQDTVLKLCAVMALVVKYTPLKGENQMVEAYSLRMKQ